MAIVVSQLMLSFVSPSVLNITFSPLSQFSKHSHSDKHLMPSGSAVFQYFAIVYVFHRESVLTVIVLCYKFLIIIIIIISKGAMFYRTACNRPLSLHIS